MYREDAAKPVARLPRSIRASFREVPAANALPLIALFIVLAGGAAIAWPPDTRTIVRCRDGSCSLEGATTTTFAVGALVSVDRTNPIAVGSGPSRRRALPRLVLNVGGQTVSVEPALSDDDADAAVEALEGIRRGEARELVLVLRPPRTMRFVGVGILALFAAGTLAAVASMLRKVRLTAIVDPNAGTLEVIERDERVAVRLDRLRRVLVTEQGERLWTVAAETTGADGSGETVALTPKRSADRATLEAFVHAIEAAAVERDHG